MHFTEDFLLNKFLQTAGYPRYKAYTKVYEAGCPICREGKSWNKKRRLYYILQSEKICCHNCGWYGSPVDFIIEVTGCTFKDLIDESQTFSKDRGSIKLKNKANPKKKNTFGSLPEDSINLFDNRQLKYHKNSNIVKKCLDIISKRRLDTATNRPNSLWLSQTDYVHKNRIIIPFFDENHKIIFYQTRTVLEEDGDKYPKYLSKVNAEKSIFNIDKIKSKSNNIFIFEGPLDACFCKNGVAVGGIQEKSQNNFTLLQNKQLSKFFLHTQIWVLDSQWQDNASMIKTQNLIDSGCNVFIWPQKYGNQFKDFNDMAVGLDINQIPHSFIEKHTYSGTDAEMELNKLKLIRR